MIPALLPQALLLLGMAVVIVVAFQRLHIPSSLGYLLVGVLLGSHTAGPVVDAEPLRALAEFGIVFLLFTIGLNFSIPQIHALRRRLPLLGTAQVVLSTAVVTLLAWALGLPVAAAFVVGAVFAQSSTTIISKQLDEQGEANSRHGHLGIAMSVFQDITAVPFLVIIPVLGMADATAGTLISALLVAVAKAALAFVIVFLVGRWLLRPLFYLVAEQRSAEVFTLTVLFVSLIAAWTTSTLGLSMAFGAFLAGMMLGETEFRHQVESTIRPFRDVLLGLFFIGIGMLFDPWALPAIWHWAVGGALVLLVVKTLLVTQIVRWTGTDARTAWRTGLLLAVGGEFGFALVAIALEAGVISDRASQIALTAVLLSMIVAPFLIRYNHTLADLLAPIRAGEGEPPVPSHLDASAVGTMADHVVICGYGRIGQGVARFMEEQEIPYVALDLEPDRVKEAHTAGERVFYGDSAERDVLEAVGLAQARLLVITYHDVPLARRILAHVRSIRQDLPIMVRTRDDRHAAELRDAGATEVVSDQQEASLMIAIHALLLLGVPAATVVQRLREQREGRYFLLGELFRGDNAPASEQEGSSDRLRPVVLMPESPATGQTLGGLGLDGVTVTALVREGRREATPSDDTKLAVDDVLVLYGKPDQLQRAERRLLG
ncbi:MAG: cation:proton antiporter [Halofilum sp. (in: g-proteobacteria)]